MTPDLITVIVLHATPPDFSGNLPTQPSTYAWVARKELDGPTNDAIILQDMFYQTNSIRKPWTTLARARGLTTPLAPDDARPLPQRSTSIGDVIGISDASGQRYFLCRDFGWAPIDHTLIQQT
jgi:hypothetical protein